MRECRRGVIGSKYTLGGLVVSLKAPSSWLTQFETASAQAAVGPSIWPDSLRAKE